MVELIILGGVVVFQGGFIVWQAREHRKREQDLLNRIMARDYADFARAEISMKELDFMKANTQKQEFIEPGIPVT